MGETLAKWQVILKRKSSMRGRFVIFSTLLFIAIAIVSCVSFVLLMGDVLRTNSWHVLKKNVEIERLRLENYVNGEIAIVMKMAKSPLLQSYFEDPENAELETLAFKEISEYREAYIANTVFWVNDKDKKFYFDSSFTYVVNPNDPENYWYDMTLYRTERYNFNINHNPDLNETKLWINAPVFNKQRKPIGMLGTGIDLTTFINTTYKNYDGPASIYFFNAEGEITGAQDASLAANKRRLDDLLGEIGKEILTKSRATETSEIIYFKIGAWQDGIVVLGKVEALNWHVAAVLPFHITDVLNTHMTLLFVAMMVIIAAVFVAFNLFAIGLFGPLREMIKAFDRITAGWDTKSVNISEIETLGTFFNMAITDPLTGIYNRRYLDGTLSKTIKSLSRIKECQLSLLMLDIDHFKKYNDAYGHNEGDKCLKKVADVLRRCISRVDDFAARYGGEEFAIVLPHTDEDGARRIAERVIEGIRECNIPHKDSGEIGRVTISIGIATSTITYMQHKEDYIKHADAALYMSKENGRNRYTHKAF